MLQFINRKLPEKWSGTFFWRVSRYFNFLYISKYDKITVKYPPHLVIKGVASDTISQQLFFQGFYDNDLSELIIETAKTGGVFVDVGANIGYCSLLFAKQNKNCKVISFEPSNKNLELLTYNIQQNNLSQNITLYPYAVGDKNEELYFDSGPEEQTGWGHLSDKVTTQKVKVVRLDSIINNDFEKNDLLKIDVEGFDMQVVLGCETLLKQGKVKKIVFEYHHQLINVDEEELPPIAIEVLTLIKICGYGIRRFAAHDYLLELKTDK